jgi:hypothetical protein
MTQMKTMQLEEKKRDVEEIQLKIKQIWRSL